jgi:hypothetical protein
VGLLTLLSNMQEILIYGRAFSKRLIYTVDTPLGGFRKHGNQKTAINLEGYLIEAEKIIRRYGMNPYGRKESIYRRFLSILIGNSPLCRYPKSIFPNFLSNFFYSTNTIVHDETDWKIVSKYLI